MFENMTVPQKEWTREQLGDFCIDRHFRMLPDKWLLGRALAFAKAKTENGLWTEFKQTYVPGLSDKYVSQCVNVYKFHPEQEGLTEEILRYAWLWTNLPREIREGLKKAEVTAATLQALHQDRQKQPLRGHGKPKDDEDEDDDIEPEGEDDPLAGEEGIVDALEPILEAAADKKFPGRDTPLTPASAPVKKTEETVLCDLIEDVDSTLDRLEKQEVLHFPDGFKTRAVAVEKRLGKFLRKVA